MQWKIKDRKKSIRSTFYEFPCYYLDILRRNEAHVPVRRPWSSRKMNLHNKLRSIILNMVVPLVFFVLLAFGILAYYSVKYTQITHNVDVSSKFNLDFKETIDLKMYHYAVGSKEQAELPISDVEDAIKLAKALTKTTYRKESRQAIKNIINYCENLESKMYLLENTKDYDSRQLQLENNIYVLTNLIQQKMMNYIYYEAGYMAALEEKMIEDIRLVILVAAIAISITIVLLLYRAFRFSYGITNPISKLCENVNRVGDGDFDIPHIEANDNEIAQLNTGIINMAGRIRVLLENVKAEEKRHHMTELQLLQTQINPHFLYNTMDTIVWLVESERYKESVDVLTHLSVFFRTTLSKGNDIITLEEEIMHTRSYLDIQQVRYQDILDYSIDLAEELKSIKIPKLTLQPLAENALYHGVKEKRGKSTITITCKEQQEKILITVVDTGIGISPERLKVIQDSLKKGERVGFGLAAVHERIQLYFGKEYGVEIQSEYEKGTTITIVISKNIEQIS